MVVEWKKRSGGSEKGWKPVPLARHAVDRMFDGFTKKHIFDH